MIITCLGPFEDVKPDTESCHDTENVCRRIISTITDRELGPLKLADTSVRKYNSF